MNSPVKPANTYDWRLIAAFLSLLIGFVFACYVYYNSFNTEYDAGVARRLSTITELKVEEVVAMLGL